MIDKEKGQPTGGPLGEEYRGYLLDVEPEPVRGGGWAPRLRIWHDEVPLLVARLPELGGPADSPEEAREIARRVGRVIIDERVGGPAPVRLRARLRLERAYDLIYQDLGAGWYPAEDLGKEILLRLPGDRSLVARQADFEVRRPEDIGPPSPDEP